MSLSLTQEDAIRSNDKAEVMSKRNDQKDMKWCQREMIRKIYVPNTQILRIIVAEMLTIRQPVGRMFSRSVMITFAIVVHGQYHYGIIGSLLVCNS